MISPPQAEALIQHHMPRWGVRSVPLREAAGAVLRETVVADRDLPPYDRVTMDGVAMAYAAWQGGCRRFRLEGVVAAGQQAPALHDPATSVLQVMTGAMLPAGADTIVPVEQCRISGDQVDIDAAAQVAPLQFLHSQGSDRRQGDRVLAEGVRLCAPHCTIAAAVGRPTLKVSARPPIAIISTGDELKPVEAAVGPHQIRSANDVGLRAALQGAGFGDIETFHVPDDPQATRDLLARLLPAFGVLIATGGVSMGRHDYVPAALQELGVKQHFHKVSQKPGKPMWFGTYQGAVPVFGLPGNPVSTLVCLHRFVVPALALAQGAAEGPEAVVQLDSPVRFPWPLTGYLPVRLTWAGTGECRAHPLTTNTSGDFAALSGSDGFVELPPGKELFVAGEVLRYYAWQ